MRLAAKATLYALPIVVVDVTRTETLAYSGAKPDRFFNRPVLANANSRTVVRPNVDTLYSTAWLDLSTQPMVLTLPPGHGRFFVVQCMDAWSNVFADPGTRTLRDRGATYLLVGPGWHGHLPAGMTRLQAPTPMVWVLARIYVYGDTDLPAARLLQSRMDVRPLSRLSDRSFHSTYPHLLRPTVKPETMHHVLEAMGPQAFFQRFMKLAAMNPAVPADPVFVRTVLQPLGLTSGSWGRVGERARRALAAAYRRVLDRLAGRGPPLMLLRQRRVNGWRLPPAGPQGSFGNRYALRAKVALLGLAQALREDAVYFNAGMDGAGNPLDGSRSYRITFAPGTLPPVQAFWSLTLYDSRGYLIPNRYARYAVSSAAALHRDPDGSTVIYLQPDPPDPAHGANWLPTPAGRAYQLSLRCYWPDATLLDDQWAPPPIAPSAATPPACGRSPHTSRPASATRSPSPSRCAPCAATAPAAHADRAPC